MSESSKKPTGWSPEAKAYHGYLKRGKELGTTNKGDEKKFREAVKTQRTERLEKERGPFEMALTEMLQQEKRDGLLNDATVQRALARAGVADLGALARQYEQTFPTVDEMREHLQARFTVLENRKKNQQGKLRELTPNSHFLQQDEYLALSSFITIMMETDLARILSLSTREIPTDTLVLHHLRPEQKTQPCQDKDTVSFLYTLETKTSPTRQEREDFIFIRSMFLRPDVLTAMRRFGQHKRKLVHGYESPQRYYLGMRAKDVDAFVEGIPSRRPDIKTPLVLRGEQYVPKGSSPEFIRAEKRTLEIVDEALEQIKALEDQTRQEQLEKEASDEAIRQDQERQDRKALLQTLYRLHEITDTLQKAERAKPSLWQRLTDTRARQAWSTRQIIKERGAIEQTQLFKEVFMLFRDHPSFSTFLNLPETLTRDTPENREALLQRVEELVVNETLTPPPAPKELQAPTSTHSHRAPQPSRPKN